MEKIKPLHKIHGTESYGYGGWLDSDNLDEIQAEGRGGQRLFIFKKKTWLLLRLAAGDMMMET